MRRGCRARPREAFRPSSRRQTTGSRRIPFSVAAASAASSSASTRVPDCSANTRSTSRPGTALPTAVSRSSVTQPSFSPPLVLVEEIDDVPQLPLLAGREREAKRFLRVRSDERQPAEDDPHPSRPHVVPDELRKGVPRPLRAERTLEIGELDECHGCIGTAERDPLLGIPANSALLSAAPATVIAPVSPADGAESSSRAVSTLARTSAPATAAAPTATAA